MTDRPSQNPASTLSTLPTIATLDDLATLADYSLMDTLDCDPDATVNGADHAPRQVFSGHYVPVNPTPIEEPAYVAHSKDFFAELGFADSLAASADFARLFTGDLSGLPAPMRKLGWATGYALSIYGREYSQQCPFQTGNGYGDGRAISVLEAVINGNRWEMQLKGAGRTPYCRGADGRAVLRSSIREFLAQEHMHALGVPTSRSLSLFVSKTEMVQRPWYSPGSRSENPDMLVSEAVAISTRVAPSFIRVGQFELFARRTRNNADPTALAELEKIVLHLIDREYADLVDGQLTIPERVLLLARAFASRLTSLVANWIRVGFCQGNFNSDNCAAGGFTLDYGPFGFCDVFKPHYQPWTGGGHHFSLMNQPNAAQKNFGMFCSALRPLLASNQDDLLALDEIQGGFSTLMHGKMQAMWAAKLGLNLDMGSLNTAPGKALFGVLVGELETLMTQTAVDYTMFFRELSSIPDDIGTLKKSFYSRVYNNPAQGPDLKQTDPEETDPEEMDPEEMDPEEMDRRWSQWLEKWKTLLDSASASASASDGNATSPRTREQISSQMRRVNPKYILREWFMVPAYQQAAAGDYTLIRELQAVMTQPYAEQSQEMEDKYYRLKPPEYFALGGLSHLSCSS